MPDLSFEKWLEHCFAHEASNRYWYYQEDSELWSGSSHLTVQYLTRLFCEPCQVLDKYQDEQVDQGFWYILRPLYGQPYALLDQSVPLDDRLECIRSTAALYSDYFAERCSPHLSHRIPSPADISELNGMCYLFWDRMWDVFREDSSRNTELNRAALAVLDQTLYLPSIACQEGAIHGLGHWAQGYPTEVRESINRFLALCDIEPDLRAYAEQASEGRVQ